METLFYAVLGINVLMVPLWLLLTVSNNAHGRNVKMLWLLKHDIEEALEQDPVAAKAFGTRLEEATKALEEADLQGALRGRAARTEALIALYGLAADLGLGGHQ